MDPFFIYVSIGALILLILLLTIIGVSLTRFQSMDSFPPTQNACPDYWDVSSNPLYCGVPLNLGSKNFGHIKIKNNAVDTTETQNVGMCTASNKNFGCRSGQTYLDLKDKSTSDDTFQYVKLNNNDSWGTLYPGITERCAKKSWANTMNITWDGVSNYNGC